MLIWINTNGKYQKAVVTKALFKTAQFPADYRIHVYITCKVLSNNKVVDTALLDNVNWHFVNKKQFIQFCNKQNNKIGYGKFLGFKPQ